MAGLITVARLIAAGVAPTQARIFADPLAAACALFDISTPARIGAFIAQCRIESANFTHLEENLNYTTAERIRQIFPSRVTSLMQAATLVRNPKALANCVYAGKNGNGDVDSGDGWRYRGRGIGGLTGRTNYLNAEVGTGRPYVDQPDLVAQPSDACLSFAWYWHSIKGNLLADAWNIDAITRAVNGPAMLEATLRRQWSDEAVSALAA